MKKYLPIIFLLFICSAAMSQSYIDLSRTKVKKKLSKYLSESKITGQFKETENTLTVSIRDSKFKEADFQYFFNSNGKCMAEGRSACDSCVTVYLKGILSDASLGWKQLDSNHYVSEFSKHLSLEIKKESYIIKKILWTKKEYERIIATGKL